MQIKITPKYTAPKGISVTHMYGNSQYPLNIYNYPDTGSPGLLAYVKTASTGGQPITGYAYEAIAEGYPPIKSDVTWSDPNDAVPTQGYGEYLVKITNLVALRQYTLKISLKNSLGYSEILEIPASTLTKPILGPLTPTIEFREYQPGTTNRVKVRVTPNQNENFLNSLYSDVFVHAGNEPLSDAELQSAYDETFGDVFKTRLEVYSKIPFGPLASYSQASAICSANGFGYGYVSTPLGPVYRFDICFDCLWGNQITQRTQPILSATKITNTTPRDTWISFYGNQTLYVYAFLKQVDAEYYFKPAENYIKSMGGYTPTIYVNRYFSSIPGAITDLNLPGSQLGEYPSAWVYTDVGWRFRIVITPVISNGGSPITEYGYAIYRYGNPPPGGIDSDDLTYVNTFEQVYDQALYAERVLIYVDPPRHSPPEQGESLPPSFNITLAAKNVNGSGTATTFASFYSNLSFTAPFYRGPLNVLAVGLVDGDLQTNYIPYLKVYYDIDRTDKDFIANNLELYQADLCVDAFYDNNIPYLSCGLASTYGVDDFGFYLTRDYSTGLTPSTKYDYKLRADYNDQSSPEVNFSITTGTIVEVVNLVARPHYNRTVVLAFTGNTYSLMSRRIDWYYQVFGSSLILLGGSIYYTYDKVFLVTSPNLIANKSYSFYIKVTNIFGQSEYSPASNIVTINAGQTSALAPRVTVVPEDSRVKIYVDKLSSTLAGGLPIINYQLMFSPTDNPDYQFRSFSPAKTEASLYPGFYYPPGTFGEPLAVIEGLANGREYMVSVSAINNKGVGQQAPIVKFTPLGVPNFPRVAATIGNSRVTVSFIPPPDTGGSPILKYQYSTDAGQTWLDALVEGGTQYDLVSPIVIIKHSANNQLLNNGQLYQVRLRAVNAQGPGDASITIQATPVGPPAPPTITEVISADQRLVIKFTPPATQVVNAPVLGYKYSLDDSYENFDGNYYITVVPVDNQFTLSSATIPVDAALDTRLYNDRNYTVRLKAFNILGDGSPVAATGTPMPLPRALEITNIVPRSKKLDVYFNARLPAEGVTAGSTERIWYTLNGGDKITETTLDLTSPLTITGGDFSPTGLLTNNIPYTVRLYAKNKAGFGVAYNAVTAIPVVTMPTAPTITGLLSTNISGQLSITFNPPTDIGGTEIIDYEYIAYFSGQETTATPLSSNRTSGPIVIENLTNGELYFVKIRAVNAVGAGAFSNYMYRRPFSSPLFEIVRIDPVATDLLVPQLKVTYDVLEHGGYGLLGNPEGPFTIQYQVSKFANFTGAVWQSYRITGNTFKYITNPFYIDVPLEYDTEYYVKIKADENNTQTENTGNFIESEAVAVTPRRTIPPPAPVITEMTAPERGTVHIYFTPGPNNGTIGTTIGYKWIDKKKGGTINTFPPGTTSPLVIFNLTDGYYVNLNIVAYNEYGDSAPSNEGAMTTPSVPFPPTILNAKIIAETGELTAGFTPPYYINPGNHRPAINYAYSLNLEGEGYTSFTELSPAQTTSPLSITNFGGVIGDGRRYVLRLAAVNEIGLGVASTSFVFKPPTGPDEPTIVSFVPGIDSITITYKAPPKSGSASIKGYTCKYSSSLPPFTFNSSGSADGVFTLSNLTINTYYMITLRAINSLNVIGLPSVLTEVHTVVAPRVQQVGYETVVSDIYVLPIDDAGATGAQPPAIGSFLFIDSLLYRYGKYTYSDDVRYVNGKAYRLYTGWYNEETNQTTAGAPSNYYVNGLEDTEKTLEATPLAGTAWVTSATIPLENTGATGATGI